MITKDTRTPRKRRQARVRDRVRGTDRRPRLSVFRSNKHIYAQVISDESGKTLVAASTMTSDLRGQSGGTNANRDAAKRVGALVAKLCLDRGIDAVVFDRNGYLYHGRIATLADAAREAGLKF